MCIVEIKGCNMSLQLTRYGSGCNMFYYCINNVMNILKCASGKY